jgi:regulator of cell morphogenesis and NO signaling
MGMPTIETSVGELVAARPSRSRVFQRLGIDFCCGGKLSLAEACRRKGLDAAQTLDVLLQETAARSDAPDPAAMTLTDLCDHIEATHHAPLRTELPRLIALAEKVANVHGDHHPWLREVREIVGRFAADMEEHMMKEEAILFPMIRLTELAAAAGGGRQLAAPIHVMELEHDAAGNDLARLRELSNGFVAPAGACGSFRALLDGLRELGEDMQFHVHKENNVLFPRVLALTSPAVVAT